MGHNGKVCGYGADGKGKCANTKLQLIPVKADFALQNILQINLQSLTASVAYFGYFVKSKMI